MKPSMRILLVGAVIELGLAGLCWFLVNQLRTGAMQPSGTLEEAVATIFQIFGSIIGGLFGLLVVVFFVLRRKETLANPR